MAAILLFRDTTLGENSLQIYKQIFTYGAPWRVLKTKTPKTPYQMTLNFID